MTQLCLADVMRQVQKLTNGWLVKFTLFCKCDSPSTTIRREIKAAEVGRFWWVLEKSNEIKSGAQQQHDSHSVTSSWCKSEAHLSWKGFLFSYFLSFFFWVVKIQNSITGERVIWDTGQPPQFINLKKSVRLFTIHSLLYSNHKFELLHYLLLLFLVSQERISYASNL